MGWNHQPVNLGGWNISQKMARWRLRWSEVDVFFLWSSDVLVTTDLDQICLIVMLIRSFLQVPVWWNWSCQHKHMSKHIPVLVQSITLKKSRHGYIPKDPPTYLDSISQWCSRHPEIGGNDAIWLAHIFQMGWFNHQLGKKTCTVMNIGTISGSGARSLHTTKLVFGKGTFWLTKISTYMTQKLTWPMAKLQTFWDYIFSRENKQLQTSMNQGPQRQSSAVLATKPHPQIFYFFFWDFANPESLLCVSFLQDKLWICFMVFIPGRVDKMSSLLCREQKLLQLPKRGATRSGNKNGCHAFLGKMASCSDFTIAEGTFSWISPFFCWDRVVYKHNNE